MTLAPDPEYHRLDLSRDPKADRDKRLFTAYAVTVVLPHVGRPILNASGAMGSGKTTICRAIKRLAELRRSGGKRWAFQEAGCSAP
jgi:hypothetical protein